MPLSTGPHVPGSMDLLDGLKERMFGQPEGWLGRLGGHLMVVGKEEQAAWAIDLLRVARDHDVLEIGFGPGVGIELLADIVEHGSVAGIDPSETMLEMAVERNADLVGTSRGDLHQASADDLPFDDASFDRVLAINTAQAWPDLAQGLAEIHRVLREGGRVALAFNRHARSSAQGLADALTRAGFQRARSQRGEHGVVVLADA